MLLIPRLVGCGTAHSVITLLILSVFAGNSHAIRVYEKVGFVRHDIHPREVCFEDSSYGDVLYMSRWIGDAQ